MGRFAFRPSLQLKGRDFRGLRGWAGKPNHPPLTDVPIGAYTVAAILDVLSWLFAETDLFGAADVADELYTSAGLTMLTGAAVSLFTALTGFTDWLTTTRTSHIRKTANTHAWIMIIMTLVVLVDLAIRFLGPVRQSASLLIAALSAVVFLLLVTGATVGGSLVYDYGFNVESRAEEPYQPEQPMR